MHKIERILCPVDFSDFSIRAYDYAQSLAQRYDAKLFLQHVVELISPVYASHTYPHLLDQLYQELRARGEQRLQEFVKKHTRGEIQPAPFVQEGVVIERILAFAQANAADLIVMGTHGLRGFDRLLLGSVTEKVLRKGLCPVLVVRKPAHDFVSPEREQDPIQLKKILLCTDFSDYAQRALDYGLSLAIEYGAELTLLHVLENFPASADLQTETEHWIYKLEKPIPTDARKWCTIKPMVRVGKPYEEIVQLALEAQTDLVILGVRGRNAIDLALFGSTTYRVIQLGTCPVLTIPI